MSSSGRASDPFPASAGRYHLGRAPGKTNAGLSLRTNDRSRFLYSDPVSRRSNRAQDGDAERGLGAIPNERPSLRRGLLGYRRDDVDQALEARDTELAEMRQDVAALWLAFAQHDRLIRSILDASGSLPHTPVPERAPAPAAETATPPVAASPATGVTDSAISAQLDELDQVLAAIESATQTLERTYSEETAGGAAVDGEEKPAH